MLFVAFLWLGGARGSDFLCAEGLSAAGGDLPTGGRGLRWGAARTYGRGETQ